MILIVQEQLLRILINVFKFMLFLVVFIEEIFSDFHKATKIAQVVSPLGNWNLNKHAIHR